MTLPADRFYPKVLDRYSQLVPSQTAEAIRRAYDLIYKIQTWNRDGITVRLNTGSTDYIQPRINLIDGNNITLAVAENAANEDIDITIGTSTNIVADEDFPNNTNLGFGNQALVGDGFYNTTIGTGNLNTITTGYDNTAIGHDIMYSVSTGFKNIGIGSGPLLALTTGNGNIAIGTDAGNAMTDAASNVAIGKNSLGANVSGIDNVAIGESALLSTSSNANVAVGSQALSSVTTADGNVAIGYTAGNTITTGIRNTCVGYDADVSTNTFTNSTALGNGASASASNKVRIGNSSVTVIEGQVDWTFISDRDTKENFKALDPEATLQALIGIPITSWNYIGHDPLEFRHIGPMAQDVHAAFGLDEHGKVGDDKTISSSMLASILMLGVQALAARTDALSATVADLQKQLDKLSK